MHHRILFDFDGTRYVITDQIAAVAALCCPQMDIRAVSLTVRVHFGCLSEIFGAIELPFMQLTKEKNQLIIAEACCDRQLLLWQIVFY